MDRFIGMAVFAKVVESSSFAAAARHFDMSPAMVSKHIRTLEERLGVRLLNRTTRHVSATEVGQNYYERCLRILNELEDAERAAGDLEAAPRGLLRVTTSVSFGAHQLAPAIADYLIAYPDVSIDLSLHDNYVDLLEERIDLAIRLGQLSDSSLIAKKLYTVEMVLCASPGYLAANGTPQKPRDLVKHNCLIYTYAAPRAWTFTDPKRQGRGHPHFRALIGEQRRPAAGAGAQGHGDTARSGLSRRRRSQRRAAGPPFARLQDAGNAGLCRLSAQPLSVGENQDVHRFPRGTFRALGLRSNKTATTAARPILPDLRTVTDATRHPSVPSN